MSLFKKASTAALSLPKSRTVRGYEIKRLPMGKYLEAMQLLRDIPGDVAEACFPGETLDGVLARLKDIDLDMLKGILGNVMMTIPAHVVRIAAALTQIDEERLLHDESIGLDGLVEILTAWVEVNGLGNFIPAVRSMITKIRTAGSPAQNIGSSD